MEEAQCELERAERAAAESECDELRKLVESAEAWRAKVNHIYIINTFIYRYDE